LKYRVSGWSWFHCHYWLRLTRFVNVSSF